GEVVVSDSNNHRFQIFDIHSGKLIRHFGMYGSHDGAFQSPEGGAISPQGNLVVCDYVNNRIQTFSMEGTLIRQGFIGSIFGFYSRKFNFPSSIWMGSGKMLIGDLSCVYIFGDVSERKIMNSPVPPTCLK